MTKYTFQVVRQSRTLSGPCPACGGTTSRTKTFEHTINPFNRNPDGTMRTYEEVRENVRAEAAEWVPDFTHRYCPEVKS